MFVALVVIVLLSDCGTAAVAGATMLGLLRLFTIVVFWPLLPVLLLLLPIRGPVWAFFGHDCCIGHGHGGGGGYSVEKNMGFSVFFSLYKHWE